MDSTLDILSRAFYESSPRIAVFDIDARNEAGLWRIEDQYRIPINEVISILQDCGKFVSGNKVILPLHELESAELTGEYVVVTTDRDETISFIDFTQESIVHVPREEFSLTSPSLRLRYWHPEYTPPQTPSYLAEYYEYESKRDSQPTAVSPDQQTVDASSFFDELRSFVQMEQIANKEDNRERYDSSVGSQFFSHREGIPRLSANGRRMNRDREQICTLTVVESEFEDSIKDIPGRFGIYPGNEVLVDIPDHEAFPVDAEVLNIDGLDIDLSIKWSTTDSHGAAESAFDAENSDQFRILNLLNPVPFERQLDGIDEVERDDRKRSIALGTKTLEFDDERDLGAESRSLNQYQRRAVRRSLGAEDIFCIHGPPGTGKTRTLVSLIKEAVHRNQKVLACAHSNQAIDNLLVGDSTLDSIDKNSLHAAALEDEFVLARFGNNSSNEVVNEYYTDHEKWEANVIGATTNAAHQFRIDEFDLVVVDEAAQCGIASTMIPFSRGKRLVLAGDHHQLPPYTSSEEDEDEQMKESFFEHLLTVYDDEVSTTLRKQYRMNEKIAEFPNQQFYSGKLTHASRNRDWRVRDLEPIVGMHVSGEEKRPPTGNSYYNEAEVSVVVNEVNRLLKNGVLASQIGVITPYSAQVGKIVQALKENDLEDRVKVSTVDAFQGGEREAIIVSFVRSNSNDETGFLTFPNEGPRRLNVAITRAQKRLTVIGDWETLANYPQSRPETQDSSHLFKNLQEYLSELGTFGEPRLQVKK